MTSDERKDEVFHLCKQGGAGAISLLLSMCPEGENEAIAMAGTLEGALHSAITGFFYLNGHKIEPEKTQSLIERTLRVWQEWFPELDRRN